jgi:hypothetical protein
MMPKPTTPAHIVDLIKAKKLRPEGVEVRDGQEMAHSDPFRYVRRVDLPDKHLMGWSVHYQRARKRVTRYFADRANGGRDEAYAAALHFASALPADNGEIRVLLRRLLPRKTCRSGMPGVAKLMRHPPDRGAFWVAYWDDASGHKVQKKFSVARYGEEIARELAIEARRQATERYRVRLAELLGDAQAELIGRALT